MSIFSKVTHKTLAKNRTRTVVTIIGIILSAAMITAVTTTMSSFFRYLQDYTAATEGLWHLEYIYLPTEKLSELEEDYRFGSAANAQKVGVALVNSDNDSSNRYVFVTGGDDKFYERLPVNLEAGRLPQTPYEIALRHGYLGDEYIPLGSTVTLELGYRYLDGELMTDFNPYTEGEELVVHERRTYTVVGYVDHTSYEPFMDAGETALTYWDSGEDVPYIDSFLLLKNPRDTFDFQQDYKDLAGSLDNTNYLMTLGVVRYDTFYHIIYSMAAILIGLIMFGSVSLIYNAFSISVSERTKQFGLLRSVGATKKQIRGMVFTEAVTVSAIGIPLGIVAGIAGMAVTFHFIGGALSDFLADGEIAPTFRIHVSALSVAAAAAIGFVTVLISAWAPSRRAMRVSAIEAIRQTSDVKIKRREVRTSPLTYRLFGLEGAIAGKHFKRSRKRYRATVVSLFMSVVLFISASSFCRYLTDSVTGVFSDSTDYDIRYSFHGEMADQSGKSLDEVVDILGRAEHITAVSANTNFSCACEGFTRDQLTDEALRVYFSDAPTGGIAGEDPDRLYPSFYVYGIEDGTWEEYIQRLGLDPALYTGPEALGVIHSTIQGFDSDAQRYITMTLLRDDVSQVVVNTYDSDRLTELYRRDDYEELPEEEQEALYESCQYYTTVRIGCQAQELPMGCLNANYGVCLLLPMSVFDAIPQKGYTYSAVYFLADDHEAATESLAALAVENGLPGRSYFQDVYEQSANQRGLITVVRVAAYGFITLISLIAAANVFNTISTNVFLRRREFAMLRSVGMTSRGFNRMMSYECILYGTKALLFGIPAAFGVTYLIFRSINMGYETSFYLPWSAVFIAVGSVFLVVFATMLYAMSSIKRDNPIDAMKSELM